MPIYEYACKNCGEQLEVLQKISDPAPEKCTHCGQGPMEKLMSLTSFQLKGGGWYNDGYSSPAAAVKKSDEKPSTEAPKTETKTEAKPEKKEAKPAAVAKESKSN